MTHGGKQDGGEAVRDSSAADLYASHKNDGIQGSIKTCKQPDSNYNV